MRECFKVCAAELIKIAILSPAQQLHSAAMIGRHAPVTIAQPPPMPNIGNIGKLPRVSQTGTGLNVASKPRTGGQAPNGPSVPAMQPIKRTM